MSVIELRRRLGRPLEEDDREVIDELDQMSEDAEREEAAEWDLTASPAEPPHLRTVETVRRAGA